MATSGAFSTVSNYFEAFPRLLVNPKKNNSTREGKEGKILLTNILARVTAKIPLLLDSTVYYHYDVQDGDTPEIIADKYYGNSRYHWAVILANVYRDEQVANTEGDLDPRFSAILPLAQNSLNRYITAKYGSIQIAQGVTNNTILQYLIAIDTPSTHLSLVFQDTEPHFDVNDLVTIYGNLPNSPTEEQWRLDNIRIDGYVLGAVNSPKINFNDLPNPSKGKSYPSNTFLPPGDVIVQSAVHHFENANGEIIANSDYAGVGRVVTNYEYEIERNENRRSIRLLRKELIGTVERNLISLL